MGRNGCQASPRAGPLPARSSGVYDAQFVRPSSVAPDSVLCSLTPVQAGSQHRGHRELMRIETGVRSALALVAAAPLLGWSASATAGTGFPSPWQMGMQGIVTENGQEIS